MGEIDDAFKPGEAIKPRVAKDKALNLIRKLYGFEVTWIKELNGFDDQNFWFSATKIENNPYLTSVLKEGYVLKITNNKDSQDRSFFDAQKDLMFHLFQDGFEVPLPIPNKQGLYKSLEKMEYHSSPPCNFMSKSLCQCMVRVLRFIPGKTLFEIEPWSVEHFFQCGQYVSRMDLSLKSFHHPAYNTRHLSWFLSNVPKLKEFLHVVKDPERAMLMSEIIDAFNQEVTPRLPDLEVGIIHGDVNDHNVLVKPRLQNPKKYEIASVIDFGDSQKNPLLFELATTIMYMMLKPSEVHPNQAGGYVLAGYTKYRKIPKLEMNLLRTCIAGRFAQALILGAHSYQQNSANEYLLYSAKTGWKAVEEFWRYPKDKLLHEWRETMEWYRN